MLKVVVIFSFTFIVLCNGFNRIPGNYNQIVLNQSHPVTAFWVQQKKWPSLDYTRFDYGLSSGAWESLKTPINWIINSMWPSKNDGQHPEYCFKGIIDQDSIHIDDTVQSELNIKWPIYKPRENNKYLWNVAWIRHGTCLTNLVQTDDPNKYLDKAAKMIDRYNIGTIFANEGIHSGNSYSLEFLKGAIIRTIPVTPHLRCILDETSPWKEQYLLSASICMDKVFQFEECALTPAYSYPSIDCEPNKLVHIPKLLPAL